MRKEHNQKNLVEFFMLYKENEKKYYNIHNDYSHDKPRLKELMDEHILSRDKLLKLYGIEFGCGDCGDQFCLDENGLEMILKYAKLIK
jgi:hypothetical protein